MNSGRGCRFLPNVQRELFFAASFIDSAGWFDIFEVRFNDKTTHLNSFYGQS